MTLMLSLFASFLSIGLFAVGGGMAAIPFLYDLAERTNWFTAGDLADMIAVSECTPGAIGVNMASYVGFSLSGVPGAVTATAGIILPGMLIILIIARFLDKYRNSPYVQAVFDGIKPATAALILMAAFAMIKVSVFHVEKFRFSELSTFTDALDIKALLLAAVIFALSRKFEKLHPAVLMMISAAAGIMFSFAG